MVVCILHYISSVHLIEKVLAGLLLVLQVLQPNPLGQRLLQIIQPQAAEAVLPLVQVHGDQYLLERGYQQAAVLHGEAEGRGEQDDVALLARDGHQHLPGLHPEHDLRGELRTGHLALLILHNLETLDEAAAAHVAHTREPVP